MRAVSQIIGCEMHPLNNVRVLKYLKSAYGLDDAKVNGDWYPHWVAEGFAGLEGFLDPAEIERQAFAWAIASPWPTCACVPQVFNAQRFNCDLRALSHADGDLRALHEAGRRSPRRSRPSRETPL